MFNLFRRQRALGLDIGSHSLKWALLDRGRKEVVHSGVVALFPERASLPQTLDWQLWESRVHLRQRVMPDHWQVLKCPQPQAALYKLAAGLAIQ